MKAIETLVECFFNRSETLSVAESCTGGLLSGHIVAFPGVSRFYLGGVIAYSNIVKEKLLAVPRDAIKTEGAVSRSVALAMALGVKNQMNTDWSVAITGISGPTGGSPMKPVGTVCFAVCGPNFEMTDQQLLQGDRANIQRAAVEHAANLLVKAVKEKMQQ